MKYTKGNCEGIMYEALKIVRADLTDAQGEWADVSETFSPTWTHLLKSAISLIDAVLAKVEAKQ